MHKAPKFLGAATIPAHQDVVCLTFEITSRVELEINFSSESQTAVLLFVDG